MVSPLFSSFSGLSLWSALGIPSKRFPINGTTFVSYVLPPLACYFIVAVLAVTPQMRTVRIALWPVLAMLALRATLSVDIFLGKTKQAPTNFHFASFMFSVAVRTLGWALEKEPLVRHLRPANSPPSTIMDALDLITNERGLGWEWSRGLYIPPETRPANRTAFVFWTFLSAVTHALICGALHRTILTLAPMGIGPIPEGSTIFDPSLPFPLRYFRASVISTLTVFTMYTAMQMSYSLCTIFGLLVLGQDTGQWPPLFDAPWRATSLADFWGRRWHQLVRYTFLVSGGYPISVILGRSGIIIGAFLSSAIVHHIGIMTLSGEVEYWWMLAGFWMMAPGVLAERAFYRITGKRVGGVVGWVWTMTWLALWGNVIIEGLARAGLFGTAGFADDAFPVRIPMARLMEGFDAWLHTV